MSPTSKDCNRWNITQKRGTLVHFELRGVMSLVHLFTGVSYVPSLFFGIPRSAPESEAETTLRFKLRSPVTNTGIFIIKTIS